VIKDVSMQRVIRKPWLVGFLLLRLFTCGCLKTVASGKVAAPVLGAQATHGLRQGQKDVAGGRRPGPCPPRRRSAVVGRRGPEARRGRRRPNVRQVWNVLSVVRYGSRDDYVYVGFDPKGIARTKALWLGSGTAKEWEQGTVSGANISGGKVTFDD
jgi:hypothetical protein